jgi:hypothetical protein
MPPSTPTLTPRQFDALRVHAHIAAEDSDNLDGWAHGHTPDPLDGDWEWGDVEVLIHHELLEWKDTWKSTLVRPTEAGWAVLRGDAHV